MRKNNNERMEYILSCITINTDILFYNFFGSPNYIGVDNGGIKIDTIRKFAVVLANNLPGYVFYDLTYKSIMAIINSNIGFVMNKNIICYNGLPINRTVYNSIYTNAISEKICKLTDLFFIQQLYTEDIEILIPIHI